MMNIQKLLLGTVVGTIVYFIAGFLIWGFGLEQINQNFMVNYDGLMREMPNMGWMVASMAAHALLVSYIFIKWANIRTFASGAKAGALISVIAGLGSSAMMMATMNIMSYQVVFIDLIGNLVWGAIGGGVIGWLLGRGQE